MNGPAFDVPSISIGELAARTGVTAGTLRMWESRHGFPRPTRRVSGHRRYTERDCVVVGEVARLRAGGASVPTAIAHA